MIVADSAPQPISNHGVYKLTITHLVTPASFLQEIRGPAHVLHSAGYYDVRGHAHNDFVMHAVNAGVLGLLAALALLVVVTWLLWRGYRRTLTRDAPYGWVLLGGVAAQIAVSVAGLFQVYQTDDEVEMLLYFLLGCGLGLLPRARWTAAVTDTRRLTSIAVLALVVTTAGVATAFAFA